MQCKLQQWLVKCRCGSDALHVYLVVGEDILVQQMRIGARMGKEQQNTDRRLRDSMPRDEEVISDHVVGDGASRLGANDNPQLE